MKKSEKMENMNIWKQEQNFPKCAHSIYFSGK